MSLQPPPSLNLDLFFAGIVDGLRWTAFWGAIALPFLHVPLLYSGTKYADVLLGLVVLNVACLLAGHRYARPSR
jgi:hypothetical protein